MALVFCAIFQSRQNLAQDGKNLLPGWREYWLSTTCSASEAQFPDERGITHLGSALVCFALVTLGTIGGIFALLGLPTDDPGGPLFFLAFVVGVIVFAAVITSLLATAVILSDLLRHFYHVPLWLPPLAFFLCSTAGMFVLQLAIKALPRIAPITGIGLTLVFLVHWGMMFTLYTMLSTLVAGSSTSKRAVVGE